jgi:hypothetical protein
MKHWFPSVALTMACIGVLSLTPVTARAQEDPVSLTIQLSGPPINGQTPKGRLDFSSAADLRAVKVEVQKVNLPDGTALNARANGVLLGTLTLQQQKAEIELETAYYAIVPQIHSDDVVTISTLSGQIILSDRTEAMHTVSGHIELQGSLNLAQTLDFQFRPADGSATFTRILTLSADGSFQMLDIPAGKYSLAIKGSKWLQKVVPIDLSSDDDADVDVRLPAGDINNDNRVTIADLGLLADAFGKSRGQTGFNPNADLNSDNTVNILDLGLLADSFGKNGDP